jgi:hypothetical protein
VYIPSSPPGKLRFAEGLAALAVGQEKEKEPWKGDTGKNLKK